MEVTGERYIPWAFSEIPDIHYEHLARYYFAMQFCIGKKVLDLACGEGYGSSILASVAEQATGIDIAQEAIDNARERYIRNNLRFIKGSITDIPIKGEGLYDVIICFEAMEHIDDHQTLFDEVKRLLRKDGCFIVSTPNKFLYTDLPGTKNPFHINELEFDQFNELLEQNFNEFKILGQKVFPVSEIWDLNIDDKSHKNIYIKRENTDFRLADFNDKVPLYYIAVATNGVMPNVDFSLLLTDVSCQLLKLFEKDKKELYLCKAELDQLKNNDMQKLRDIIDKQKVEIKKQTETEVNNREELRLYQNQIEKYQDEISKKEQLNQEKIKEIEEYKDAILKRNKEIEQKVGEIETLKTRIKNQDGIVAQQKQCIISQNQLEQQISNNEQEMLNLRESMRDMASKVLGLKREVIQKEENCKYLMELCEIKSKELSIIYNTFGWKLLNKFRNVRNKVCKVFNNPIHTIKKDEICTNIAESGNTELVSVVIPIYDRTDVLIESIESILDQSYQNFELILVCDGSPASTLEIVQRYEEHPKVRAFYFKNNSGNAVRGRNKAIKEARGAYLAFQDSDDVADVDRLKKSIECIQKYDVDVIYGGWRAIIDGTRDIDIENNQEVFSPDCNYEMLKEVCVPCQSTIMAKVEALRAVGGLKTAMRYREDHELWLRLAYNGYKFKAIDEILVNLRLHSNNLELKFKDEDQYWYNLMLEEHKKIIPLKPKIAYVIPGCGISGGIAVICQHANRLLRRGYDIILISEDDNTDIPWFPNQQVEILPVSKAPSNLDIVVATGWSTAYTIKNIPARKKFYFVQSDESRFYPKNSKEYSLASDSYNFDYEYMTEAIWIQKWLKTVYDKDAYYVPNGLDDNIIHQVSSIVPKGDKIRVLLEGPIDIPYKGMDDAFSAVEGLDCEVWCISSAGKPKPDWKCDMFFEKVPMNRMKEIYSSCDILLKMSRVEGFFGPPLEMMACGGTCVVGEVTGYDEYIKNEYNALVVKQRDVEGARAALVRLINDRELRRRLIENGRKTVEKWKWEPTIDILENIFY